MPAINSDQLLEQVANFKTVATKIAEVQTLIFQILEHEEVVSQIWQNVPTDFPTLIDAAKGDVFVGEDFTPAQVGTCKNRLKTIQDYLNGVATIAPGGNPGRDIRRLTQGLVRQ